MTDVMDVDAVLRDSLARIAQPGDPAGVAEAVSSRLAAGDLGTRATSSGFGGGSGVSLLPWGAIVVVAGLVGAGVGFTGLVGAREPEVIQLTVLPVDATTDAYDCPGGSPVSTYSTNERALVVARSEDSAWLAVRDSYDYSRTVWLPASVVTVDAGQGDVEAIAVADCVEPIVVVNTPTPVATEEPEELGEPTTDTKNPTTPKVSIDETLVCVHDNSPPYAEDATISATAKDNVGVVGIKITWGGADSGTADMSVSGGIWSYTYNPPSSATGGIVIFYVDARDAAGNNSSQAQTTLELDDQCLI